MLGYDRKVSAPYFLWAVVQRDWESVPRMQRIYAALTCGESRLCVIFIAKRSIEWNKWIESSGERHIECSSAHFHSEPQFFLWFYHSIKMPFRILIILYIVQRVITREIHLFFHCKWEMSSCYDYNALLYDDERTRFVVRVNWYELSRRRWNHEFSKYQLNCLLSSLMFQRFELFDRT